MHTRTELDDRWRTLVRRLYDDFDALVEDFVVGCRERGYTPGRVPADRLRIDARASFDHLLRALGGMPGPEDVDAVARRVGVHRARLGVPLEELIDAVRLDFQVLWGRLQAAADASDLPVLLAHVEQLWSTVENYSRDVQRAYLAESVVIEREHRRARSSLVARLLSDGPPADADVAALARAWEIAPEAQFAVAAAPAHLADDLVKVHHGMVAGGRMSHWQEREHGGLLIAAWHGDVDPSPLFSGVGCGIGPVAAGIADIARSAAFAEAVAWELDGDVSSPTTLVTVLDQVVARRLGDLARPLGDWVLGPLDDVRDGDALVEVVRAYARTGSVAATAETLFCHRNTVLNRMKRFAEVTGHDVTVPRRMALVLVALASRQP